MKTTALLLLFEASAAFASALQHESRDLNSPRDAGVTVLTSSGIVTGHPATGGTQVSEFLGIPYAVPPIGDLRFAPPQKYVGNSSINGTSFGFSCPQVTAFNAGGGSTGSFNIAGANLTAAGVALLLQLGQAGDRFSEDCLTLNVWVPSGGAKNKAVLLWIYGGGFNTGSTDITTYNGQYLAAQQDVIVVSANYRLNIFGFAGIPSEPNKNYGLQDQRMAVEWVRDNIAAFGGDPTHIVMFGQSAGSASLDFYSYAHVDDPIVAGFIFESGTIGFGTSQPTDISANWFTVASALACGNSTSDGAAVLSCMRTKPFDSILKAMGTTSFGPNVDNITVFSNYSARARAGNFAKLPLLIGNADYEAGIFATQDALVNKTFPQAYWDLFNLQVFTCPAGARANVSIASGVPTWRYRWFGNFPNTRLTTVPDSGAWHASELPILFNTTPSGVGLPASTPEEIAIGTYLRGAWAAFAKDPAKGLSNYSDGWPTYSPTANTLIRLAYNNQTGTNLALPSTYDINCPNTFALSNGTGNTAGNATVSSTASAGGSSSTSASPSPAKTSSNSAGIKATATWSVLASSWMVILGMSIFGL